MQYAIFYVWRLPLMTVLVGLIQWNLRRQQEACHVFKEELCRKITALYPEIGTCGLDITVEYDQEKKTWVVDLKKDNHELKHYLEIPDADLCIEGKQCVSLGLEIAQLKKNIEGKQY